MKIANRKAKSERESRLSALEAYANLGETPEHWKRFRLKYPYFFPKGLTDYFYDYAEKIYNKFKDADVAGFPAKPSLLFYSDRLRQVWTRNDPDGVNLKLLYGFEKTPGALNAGATLIMPVWFDGRSPRSLSPVIPGQPKDEEDQTTTAGLPPGEPRVDGVTGEIDWHFGCDLQQSVYDLMKQRWRAMVCPECGKFFLADKTNQKFCSTGCFGEVKRKRALEHWRTKGSAARDAKREKVK